ncbi:serine-threonine protein kinase 19-domain-containing protein [Thermoascus aurantiacus ATCC 26904]
MPLRLTSAPTAGIKKRKAAARPRASPFAGHGRQKPGARPRAEKADAGGAGGDEEQLPDVGVSRYIPETAAVSDVVQAIQHIRATMFEDLPARAGMNSTRIAEVLNFRRALPPLVSVAHVHTLLNAPTKVEKEIVELVKAGRVRRLIVPGRGSDAAGLEDCLVLAEDWEQLVRSSSDLDQQLKDRFLKLLDEIGNSSAVPAGFFSPEDSMALIRAGFLVSSSSIAKGDLDVASLPLVPPSLAAASATRSDADQQPAEPQGGDNQFWSATMFLSLPNTGPYLRLLGAGRSHLLSLLKKSSYNEAPLYLLRDRWDGAVESDKGYALAKRARGESTGVLPGRTKKWKELYGMSFRWILEEAVGAGLVELFETGSVGPGVRCL